MKDRGAWHAAVHGVAKRWTQLNNWTTRSPYQIGQSKFQRPHSSHCASFANTILLSWEISDKFYSYHSLFFLHNLLPMTVSLTRQFSCFWHLYKWNVVILFMKISYLLCISHFIKLIHLFIYQIYTFILIPFGLLWML